MPWILDPDGKLQQQDDENAVQSRDLSGSAGAGSVTSPAVGASASAASPAATDSGTGFTDINKYLALNGPDASKLGQKVATGIEGKTTAATGALDKGQQEFADALKDANPKLTSDEVHTLATNPDNLTSFVKDPTNIERFTSTAAGEYKGPSKFDDVGSYGDLYKSVYDASQAGKNSETTGGKELLIKDVYQKPERAKARMLGLDEALVEQSPEGINAINEKGKAASAVDQRLKDIQTSALTDVGKVKDDVIARKDQIQGEFLGDGGTYKSLKKGITDRVGALSAQATSAQDEAKHWLDPTFLNENITSKNFLAAPKKMNMWGKEVAADDPSGFDVYEIDPSKISISQAALDQMGVSKEQYVAMLNSYYHTQQMNQNFQSGYVNQPGEAARDAIQYGDYDPSWGNPFDANAAVKPTWTGIPDFNQFVQWQSPTSMGINNTTVATDQEKATLDALGKLFGSNVDTSFIGDKATAGEYKTDLTDFNYKALMDLLTGNQQAINAGNVLGSGLGGMASDARVKMNVEEAAEQIDEFLKNLSPVSWEYKDRDKYGSGRKFGVMAQDMEKSEVGRSFVFTDEDGVKRIDYGSALAAMMATIKHLSDKIEKLEGTHGTC